MTGDMTNTIKGPEVRVVTHYFKDDVDFMSDYTSVSIFVNGEELSSVGDYMYDNGKQIATGFVLGLEYVYGKGNLTVTYENVADYEG